MTIKRNINKMFLTGLASARNQENIEGKPMFVIGVDGGGTKTVAVLANQNGQVLSRAKTGPSNPHKVGIKRAVLNLGKAMNKVLPYESHTTDLKWGKSKHNLRFIYIALAGGLERNHQKTREIKTRLLKEFPEFLEFKKEIRIAGDQLAAFRSGTGEAEGLVLIAGTGSIGVGWSRNRKVVVGGWDYVLGDQGSGFWLGQKALQSVCKSLDRRGPKTLLTDLVFRKWNIKEGAQLFKKVYQKDMVTNVSSVSVLVEEAAQKGDKIAKQILEQAGEEISLIAVRLIKELGFSQKTFPIVLVGSVFNSTVVLDVLKSGVYRVAQKSNFIRPQQEPVMGAVKLALSYAAGRNKSV